MSDVAGRSACDSEHRAISMSKSEDDETVDRTETVETAGKEGADGDAPSDQLETASMNPGAGAE